MKLQASQFAEVFAHLRDHAKPYTPQDAADLAKVRAPMPPTREELNKHKRRALGRVHVDAKRVPTLAQVRTREVCDAQHAFHKAMMAQLGGNRTIAPSDEGRELNREREAGLHFIPPVSKRELVPVSEIDKLHAEGARLYKAYRTELEKTVMWANEPTFDFGYQA